MIVAAILVIASVKAVQSHYNRTEYQIQLLDRWVDGNQMRSTYILDTQRTIPSYMPLTSYKFMQNQYSDYHLIDIPTMNYYRCTIQPVLN